MCDAAFAPVGSLKAFVVSGRPSVDNRVKHCCVWSAQRSQQGETLAGSTPAKLTLSVALFVKLG